MTTTRTFRIFEDELQPRMVIEASAGTGKTYTIVGLFVRMLLQCDVSVNEILVVTFTRMATRELKDRILLRLRESLEVAEKKEYNGPDSFLTELAVFCRSNTDAPGILRDAIRNFDDARIHTIHGFCQKILREEALEAGTLFENEVRQTDEFLMEAAEDFWRLFVDNYTGSAPGEYYIRKAMEYGKTPSELLRTLAPILQPSDSVIEPIPDLDPIPFLETMISLREKITGMWRHERERVFQELLQSNIRGMAEKTVAKLCAEFDLFAGDPIYRLDQPASLIKFTTSWLEDDSNMNKRGENIRPQHPLFDLCEEYAHYVDRLPSVQTVFLYEAAGEIRKLRAQKAANASVFTYDDLLLRLDEALSDPETGKKLAGRLQKKCPYALIDEFQDTDPVQYSIFDRIYPAADTDSVLVMIGDPKQSIYRFRGADIYAYLNARDQVVSSGRYTLTHNFRSSESLIQGVNALFTVSEYPFLEEKIQYPEAKKGSKPTEEKITYKNPDNRCPLQIHFSEGVDSRKSDAVEYALKTVCNQIVEMIHKGSKNDIRIGRRNLQGGDIAVLVNEHREANKLKELLKEKGIDSVTHSRDNVFRTREAERFRDLISAVLDPTDQQVVHTALISGFFGSDLSVISHHIQDEVSMARIIDLFLRMRDQWYAYGIYSMFRMLLYEERALVDLGTLFDGERVITNLQQLAEICSNIEQTDDLDPGGLHRWYLGRLTETDESEEQILRLESDRELVRISTIHNSKGLEFPVVFCPVLWNAKDLFRARKVMEEYHDPDNHFRATLNIDQLSNERRLRAEQLHRHESVSEDVRKAYVALTRAQYECHIIWQTVNSSHLSGLGAALLGKEKVERLLHNGENLSNSDQISDQYFRDIFTSLSERYPESISFLDLTETDVGVNSFPPLEIQESLQYTRLGLPDRLEPLKQSYSFSSLSYHDQGSVHIPDHDQWLESYIDYVDSPPEELTEMSIFTFPKGARAGTLIHKLFEDPAFNFRTSSLPDEKIRQLLLDFGFDKIWAKVLKKMMKDVSGSDFYPLELSGLFGADQIREMEFNFPALAVDVKDLFTIIRSESEFDKADNSITIQDSRLLNMETKGYMTGFIDLVARYNGVYYILDYKSNFLGDTPENYHSDQLSKEVQASKYDLQYHLYTLALKLYLEKQDPSFDYETDFGGVYYLFVRGMSRGSDNGIYFHKPDLKVIEQLEKRIYRKRVQ